MNLTDWIGTLGVLMILVAYFLNIFKWIDSESILFYILNILGAALACTASWLIHYWPFVILEGTWTLVSLVALVKSLKNSSIGAGLV